MHSNYFYNCHSNIIFQNCINCRINRLNKPKSLLQPFPIVPSDERERERACGICILWRVVSRVCSLLHFCTHLFRELSDIHLWLRYRDDERLGNGRFGSEYWAKSGRALCITKMFDLFSITLLLHKAKNVLEKWLIYKAISVNS